MAQEKRKIDQLEEERQYYWSTIFDQLRAARKKLADSRYHSAVEWISCKDQNPFLGSWLYANVIEHSLIENSELDQELEDYVGMKSTPTLMVLKIEDGLSIELNSGNKLDNASWSFCHQVENHYPIGIANVQLRDIKTIMSKSDSSEHLKTLMSSWMKKLTSFPKFAELFFHVSPACFFEYLIRIFGFTHQFAGYFDSGSHKAISFVMEQQLDGYDGPDTRYYWGGELREKFNLYLKNKSQ